MSIIDPSLRTISKQEKEEIAAEYAAHTAVGDIAKKHNIGLALVHKIAGEVERERYFANKLERQTKRDQRKFADELERRYIAYDNERRRERGLI